MYGSAPRFGAFPSKTLEPSDHLRNKSVDLQCSYTFPSIKTRPAHKGRRVGSRPRVNKYCQAVGCGNISVSRGLCRSHGGGRRCHFAGCPKSAQSRSSFCWAHGGGHRCEVKGCMRSRKSKHLCVDHLCLETAAPMLSTCAKLPKIDVVRSVRLPALCSSPRLPCLQEALQSAHRPIMML
jgi:hypothetical protein